jgi:hypothetical protein
MSSSRKRADQPIAAAAGIDATPVAEDDPYRALDELMEVVEALCPDWPSREPFVAHARMLL